MNKVKLIALTLMLILPTFSSYADFSFSSTEKPWLWLNAGAQVYSDKTGIPPDVSGVTPATDGDNVQVWNNLMDPTQKAIQDYGSSGRTVPSYQSNLSHFINFHPSLFFNNPRNQKQALLLNQTIESKPGSQGLTTFIVMNAMNKDDVTVRDAVDQRPWLISYGGGSLFGSFGIAQDMAPSRMTDRYHVSSSYVYNTPMTNPTLANGGYTSTFTYGPYLGFDFKQPYLVMNKIIFATGIITDNIGSILGTNEIYSNGFNLSAFNHKVPTTTIAAIKLRPDKGQSCHTMEGCNYIDVTEGIPAAAHSGGFTIGMQSDIESVLNDTDSSYSSFYGDISEIISFDGLLDTAQTKEVQTYLALKYGITLVPAEYTAYTTKVWHPDALITPHNKHIAGLIKNTAADLDQRVSHSIDTESILTLSTNTDFTSANGENDTERSSLRPAFTDDTALLWGSDDAGALRQNLANSWNAIYTTSDIPLGYMRLVRTWGVQITGVVPPVNLQVVTNNNFFLIDQPFSSYYILKDHKDGHFISSTLTPLTQKTTVKYQVNNLSFTDGQQFTFATEAIDYEFTKPTIEVAKHHADTLVHIPLLIYSPITIPETTLNFSISYTLASDTDFVINSTYTIPAGDYTTAKTLNVPLILHSTIPPNATITVKIASASNHYAILADIDGLNGANNTTTITALDLPVPRVTPDYTQGLTCAPIPVTFSLVRFDGTPVTDETGMLLIQLLHDKGLICTTPDLSNTSSNCVTGHGSFPLDASTGSTIKLYIASKAIDQIVISDVTYKGNYGPDTPITLTFSPYALTLKTSDPLIPTQQIQLVAGQPSPQILQVIAPDPNTGQCTVLTDYTGVHQYTISPLTYTMPSSGTKPIPFDNQATASTTSDASYQYSITNTEQTNVPLTFDQGETPATFSYHDAGEIRFTLTDPAYTWCKKAIDPVLHPTCSTADLAQLSGTFIVQARPYTFAICQPDNIGFPHGNSDGGLRFGTAGLPFSAIIKPIVWVDPDPLNGSGSVNTVNVSSPHFCNQETTPNFVQVGSPIGHVVITETLDTPHGGDIGLLTGTLQKSFQAISNVNNNYLTFDDLAWNEVGSINLIANASNYLGMTINPATVQIGRFAPDHFSVDADLISGDHINIGHLDFSYMDEPFVLSYTLTAQSSTNEITKNYDAFNIKDNFISLALAEPTGQTTIQPSYSLINISDITRIPLVDDTSTIWTNGAHHVSQEAFFKKLSVHHDGPYSVLFAIKTDLTSTADHVPVIPNTVITGTPDIPVTALANPVEFRDGYLHLIGECAPSLDGFLTVRALYYQSSTEKFDISVEDNESTFLAFDASYTEPETDLSNTLDNLDRTGNTDGYVYAQDKSIKSDTKVTNGVAKIWIHGHKGEITHNWLKLTQAHLGINIPWLSYQSGSPALSDNAELRFGCYNSANDRKIIYKKAY